jgi:uncharacterized protein
MLCDIHEKLGIKNSVDPSFIRAALGDGHWWAIRDSYSGVFGSRESTDAVVSETRRILWMYDLIERCLDDLPKEDAARITKAANTGNWARFSGFDGNNEAEHLLVARCLIEDMDQFGRYKGRHLNSHMQVVPAYRRMLTAFDIAISSGETLTADKAVAILRAVHGDAKS